MFDRNDSKIITLISCIDFTSAITPASEYLHEETERYQFKYEGYTSRLVGGSCGRIQTITTDLVPSSKLH